VANMHTIKCANGDNRVVYRRKFVNIVVYPHLMSKNANLVF
jgi:hypothetical protein